MSITTSFTICQANGCSSLIFNDATGQYSADNLYGYNSPNEDINGATAYLNVIKSSTDIVRIDLTGFPTIDKTKEFTITGEDLGYASGIIPDGIYEFEYVVTLTSGTILTQNIEKALFCNVKCCVSQMFLELNTECNDCIKSLEQNKITALLMLKGLEFSSTCGDVPAFNDTLTQLNKLCKNNECSSCK